MSFFPYRKKNLLKGVEYTLERTFQLLIVLIPTQLAVHFWPRWSYVYGIRVDYLSPTIYLTDILILLILFFWVLHSLITSQKFKLKKNISIYIFLIIFVIINIYLSVSKYAAFFKWLKISELFLFATFVVKYKKIEIHRWILQPLIISAVIFTGIAILQIIKGGTIGGILYLLGERSFSVSTPGIALVNILGRQFLRAYSTFPHPNSLAGFMGASFFIILNFKRLFNKQTYFAGLSFSILGLIISFSKTALIVFLICLCLYFLLYNMSEDLVKRGFLTILITVSLISILSLSLKKGSFSNNILESESVRERVSLIETSSKMLYKNYFLGVGLNNFILNIPKYSSGYSWNLQPVHNIFILLLAETGAIGLLLFFGGIYKIINIFKNKKNFYLLIAIGFILLTGVSDHYWITIQQNLIIEALLIGLMFRRSYV